MPSSGGEDGWLLIMIPPPVLTGSGDTGRRLVAFLSARNTGSPSNCGGEYTAAMAACQDKLNQGLPPSPVEEFR